MFLRLVTTMGQRKQKFYLPDFRISRSDALPLCLRDSTVSKAHYEVHT